MDHVNSYPGLSELRSPAGQPLSPLARLRKLAAMERSDLGVVIVYSVVLGLVSLAVPVATQALVNRVAFTALLQPIIALAILVFIGLVAAAIVRTFQAIVVESLQQRFFVRTTHDSVMRLTQADANGYAHHTPSELMNRFFEVASIQKAAAFLLIDGLSVFLQGLVSLLLLGFYHPYLLAFDILLLACITFFLFGLGRHGVRTAVEESSAKYATAAWLQEMGMASRTFKARGGAEFALTRGDALATAYVRARRKHFKILLRQIVASYLLQALAIASLLGLGGALVIWGELTLGQLVAAELVVTGLLASVAKLGKYLESYYDLAASVHKVGMIVDLPAERKNGINRTFPVTPAQLDLNHVAFTYPGQTRSVLDVSLNLEPGGRLGILGSDASGKSTLADILYGLRSPSSGDLRLDGVDLRTLHLQELRAEVSLAGKPEVFDGTVLENLHLGRDEMDANFSEELLKMVDLSSEIAALPDGLCSQIGSSGNHLSTSQSARLTIARSLAQRPRLLVIDQSLDGLGTESARKVLAGIAGWADRPSLLVLTSSQEVASEIGRFVRLDAGPITLDGESS